MKKLAFIFSVLLVAVYFANLMYTDSKEAKIKLEQMLRKTTVDKAEMDRFLPVGRSIWKTASAVSAPGRYL